MGLFGANTQSDLPKTLTVRELSVTVWTGSGHADNSPEGAHARRERPRQGPEMTLRKPATANPSDGRILTSVASLRRGLSREIRDDDLIRPLRPR